MRIQPRPAVGALHARRAAGAQYARRVSAALIATTALTFALAGTARAQDAAFGKSIWLTQANCAECHGWMGDGVQEIPQQPQGANLRQTTLTLEQLSEVIMCGRPGTPMPHYDPRAYTDARCYGMTAAQIGNQAPPPAGFSFIKRHFDALAAFILSDFAGKGPPTKASCISLLGNENPRCERMP